MLRGVDAEDFAVFTFISSTVTQSRKIIETPSREELKRRAAARAAPPALNGGAPLAPGADGPAEIETIALPG